MTMIEKVARALALYDEVSKGYKEPSDESWPAFRKYAKTAIQAMLEPTEEMETEAKTMNKLLGLENLNAAMGCYKCIIQAALKD